MCRRSNRLMALALAACVAALMPPIAARADDVSLFLEQHGLKQLLAVHLEQQLEHATAAEERSELVLRLAGLYAELLETVSDPVQRLALEERSRKLLEQTPANSAAELRLALLRTSYRGAEKVAENHRLRLAATEELETARKTLTEIIPQLTGLRQQLKQEVETADRRLARVNGADSVLMTDAADRTRNLYSQCTFLTAWALYYQSWLNDRSDNARAAEPLFGELLSPENSNPQPAEVSVDLRSVEAVARSVLGMALCKSLTASAATAISWVELLESDGAFEPLRAQAPAWKMAIYLEHGEYQQVRDLLDQHQLLGVEIPLAWLRLVAVNALEDTKHTRQSDELARYAVTALAARGELEQVLDLAKRYGTQSLGTSGFALQYVHGLTTYQEARQAHGNEKPTLDSKFAALYDQAAASLKAAVNESDAGKYPSAAAACRRLIGWCYYFQSRFLDAKDAFDQASMNLSGDEAAEALWMAIVCTDKVAEAGGSAELQTQLVALTDRFLNQFPSNEHAPKLRLRRAISQKGASAATVAELLAIPAGSDVYNSAQRRASDLLYQLFRDASGEQKLNYANQFLAVALPLIGRSGRAVDLTDPAETQRLIARCRQVLEVSLTDGVDRLIATRSALDALSELKDVNNIDLAAFMDEIDCRRAQERLHGDDAQTAGAIADQLWSRDQASIWTRIAARAMFKYGYKLWKNAEATPDQKKQGIEMVVRYGGRVLYEFKDNAQPLDPPGALGYHSAVAEASMTIWEQTGDQEKGKAALFLFDKLLEKRPDNAGYLRSTAILSEKYGEHSKALDCWRRLAAGTKVNSDPWFEAKVHLIELLAASDPARAREVMDQHKQFNPDYGPEPWAAQLKALDERIAAAIQKPASSSAPAQATTSPSDEISGDTSGGSINP